MEALVILTIMASCIFAKMSTATKAIFYCVITSSERLIIACGTILFFIFNFYKASTSLDGQAKLI